MSDDFLPSGILRAMEILAESMRPYQEALSELEKNPYFAQILEEPYVSKIRVLDDALSRSAFCDALAKSVAGLLSPYHDLSGIEVVMAKLGTSFSGLLKPDAYALGHAIIDQIEMPIQAQDISANMRTAIEPFLCASTVIDTSWLQGTGLWLADKTALSSVNIDAIKGMNSSFTRLCELERETCLLDGMPASLTSAAAQIASITKAFEQAFPQGWQYDDLLASTRLLNDYCSLATKQHELLQCATSSSEVEWRLGVLDAASKYVDRQVNWSLELKEALSNEETDGEIVETETEPTTLSLIPTHVGYTRRESIKKTPTEALSDSILITITEKGKNIVKSILDINRIALDNGQNRLFGLSETVVYGMISVGDIVCSNGDQMGTIIDFLYFVFYENIEHIKILIGDGDKNKGDKIMRDQEIYQCIFQIKTIRSDFRHDLDHGSAKDRKVHFKNVGDCYKRYCGNRPIKPKEYKQLQDRLYDDVISLENHLISMLRGE